MAKFADQWEPNGPFGIVTDANMSGGYRVVTNDADKSDITVLPPERQKVGMLVYVSATDKTWRLTTVGVRSPGTESYSSAPVFAEVTLNSITLPGGNLGEVMLLSSGGVPTRSNKLVFSGLPPATGATLRVGGAGGSGSIVITAMASGSIDTDAAGELALGDATATTVNIGRGAATTITIGGAPGSTTNLDGVAINIGSAGSIGSFNGSNFVVLGALRADGILNANGGIGISTGTGLNLGNDATITSGINIGTASATGGVAIGSGTNAVTVGGLLNADGGIGRSTNGALNIGNDANVSGLNIGTSLASGGVAIGGASNNVTMPGTVIVGTNLRADLDGGATLGNGGRFNTVFTQTLNASTLIAANSITVDIGTTVAKFGTVYTSRVNTDLVLSDTVALNNRSSRDGTSTINNGAESYVNLTADGTPPLRFAPGANLGQILVVELPVTSATLINQTAAASGGDAAHQLKSSVAGCAAGDTLTVIWNGSKWLEVARSCA